MVTVNPPWVMAAGSNLTSLPITIVPVRLFITTRAGASAGVNSKFSSVAKKPTRCPTSRGAETRTEAASIGVAMT